MDAIVRTATKIIFPFTLVFGIYVAFHGHLTPGGGFPAGVILGTAFLLLLIASDRKIIDPYIKDTLLIYLKSAFGFMLMVLVLWGPLARSALIRSQEFYTIWSGGFTILLNLVGGFIVVMGVIIIAYSFASEDDLK